MYVPPEDVAVDEIEIKKHSVAIVYRNCRNCIVPPFQLQRYKLARVYVLCIRGGQRFIRPLHCDPQDLLCFSKV
jgi:hypothetical protein